MLKQPDLYKQPFGAHVCIGFLKLNNSHILPETNSKFTPENAWLEDYPFLLG